jgi:parvulin-like peptidyl-prolyl isomerase
MTAARRLLLFFLGGALLFAAQREWRDRHSPVAQEPIAVEAADVERLRRAHIAATGREPDPRELRVLVDAEIEAELLFRAARDLALASEDRVVQQRLVRDMRFLEDPAADGSSSRELLRGALDLGIDDQDLVVRRRLVQRLRLAIVAAARGEEPSEEELRAHLEAHADDYRAADRVRVRVLFFDPALGPAEARARAALARLRRDPQSLASASGDPPAVATEGLYAERELAKLHGGEFARAVLALPVGEWSEPLSSAFGSNLVLVEERFEGSGAALRDVRSAVRDALLEERGRRALRDAIGELRLRYPVVESWLP